LQTDGLGDDLHDAFFQRQDVVAQLGGPLRIVPGVSPVCLLEAGDPLAVLDESGPPEFGQATPVEPNGLALRLDVVRLRFCGT
jgi:hypothetical protein